MSLAYISLSSTGARVGERLVEVFGGELYLHDSVEWSGECRRFERLSEITAELFHVYRKLVFIAPSGAVVRVIAPHLHHKTLDPAVVVVDVGARHAVSLVSGHEGGANDLALDVANALGAEPVITTTSEALKDLIVGIGCRRGTDRQKIETAITQSLDELGVTIAHVRLLASIDIKANEPGLLETARALGIPLRLIASDEIRACQREFQHSEAARRHLDLPAVAEPAALLAGRRTRFVLRKKIWSDVTIAIAREDLPSLASDLDIDSTEHAELSRPSAKPR